MQTAPTGQLKLEHWVLKFEAPHAAGTHHQSGYVQAAPEHGLPAQVALA
jgi:hypothetical protein